LLGWSREKLARIDYMPENTFNVSKMPRDYPVTRGFLVSLRAGEK